MVKEMKHTSGDTRKLLKGIPITKPFKEYLDICTKTAEIVSTDRVIPTNDFMHT